jgi:Protein of unknown function (DUF2934)
MRILARVISPKQNISKPTVFTGLNARVASTNVLAGFKFKGRARFMVGTPSKEAIERRAYEIYERRGRQDGHDVEDWLAAEEELTSRVSASEAGSRIRNAIAQAMQKPSAVGASRS